MPELLNIGMPFIRQNRFSGTIRLMIAIAFVYASAGRAAMAQVILDPKINPVLHNEKGSYVLSAETSTIRTKWKSKAFRIRALYFYNPDGSLAKKDIYANDKIYYTYVFLHRNGRISSVLINDYMHTGRSRITESYSYKNGRISTVTRSLNAGIWHKNRRYPLQIMKTFFGHDAKGRLIEIVSYQLQKIPVHLSPDENPASFHLSSPAPSLRPYILVTKVKITYVGNSRRPSEKTIRRGIYGYLTMMQRTTYEYGKSVIERTEYPGTDTVTTREIKHSGAAITWTIEVAGRRILSSTKVRSRKRLTDWNQGMDIDGTWTILHPSVKNAGPQHIEASYKQRGIGERIVVLYDSSGNWIERRYSIFDGKAWKEQHSIERKYIQLYK